MVKDTKRTPKDIVADIESLLVELKASIKDDSPKEVYTVPKIQLVRRYVNAFPDMNNKQYIEAFKNLFDMSEAHTRTYLNTIKKENQNA